MSGWVRILTLPQVTGKVPSSSTRGILRSALHSTARCKVWEVALRNAIHRRLAERYGEAWYDNPDAGLDRGAVERIASARMVSARDGHDEGPPRIVAALSFGFWVSLLGPGGRVAAGRKANYEMTLWRPALRGAFVHCARLTRKEAHRPLNSLRTLRNRIAHHEPVFARDLGPRS